MRRYLLSLSVGVTSLAYAFTAVAADKSAQVISDIPNLSEIKLPSKDAQLLTQPDKLDKITQSPPTKPEPETTDDADINLEVTGEEDTQPQSSPVYVIDKDEIQKQGANSAAEVLRGLPGFAINDAGFGADIHTGTFYRGQSINQSVFLLNGRPINSNINTYHGNTDLNSIPVESIERVELSSGTASTLYGSEAVGGVVNIITKLGEGPPRFSGLVQYGSYGEDNYRTSYGGALGSVKFNIGYEKYDAENDYKVPVGAVNRDANGRFFNGDTATSNYFGNVTLDVNPKNTISFDTNIISSRRGLTYFGFPLQRDRLDHDVLNAGLSWKSQLGNGKDSTLNATIGYAQDYFSTYGPSGSTFSRQASLDSQALTARVEHQWQFNQNNLLRWGLDLKNNNLDGDVLSNIPNRIRFNGNENRDRFQTAIFALNTWNLTKNFQADLGLRQNFNSEFGSYLNPSVGLKYAPSDNIAVRGSWASVQRNPGIDQLYVYDTVHGWLPNPDLKPETGYSWTAGLDVKLSNNLTGQFTYFASSLDNRLAVSSAGQWTNIGLVNTNGLEAALRLRIAREWSTFLNYTYTDARIESGLEKGLQLGFVPYSVAQMGLGYESNGWQVNLIASYNSGSRRAFYTLPGQSTTDFSPSWLNLDLGARIPITRTLGLNLFVENLADVQYEKANRVYQPGRAFRIGVSSSF
ncbi:TonB-dependent receptor, plug [Tolypothrix sp. NIES-4075]|uniref:TonB-dependent receptor plug domain-containing protein n=1 Tax=Tolypothrix sp. NIES-4075 TaxID=2005459 RepID=UPI000B5C4080|nr:TonB-dependent receptor [Tolypothrix sp. NIES-4075]GAX42165.1 TonB-dependent receptor, plug [Tolypothrix sp. NIES-4075]